MTLTSQQNPLLQKVRRAVADGRPMADGIIAAEGPHLLAEALTSPWRIEHILCSTSGRQRYHALLGEAARRAIDIIEVGDRAFKPLSDTEHTQGILTLLCPRTFTLPGLLESPGPLIVLDGMRDPGNAGAILRSTEAFGGCGVVLTEGSVRSSNGKFLRAAAGSLFRLPLVENLPAPEIIQHLAAAGRTLYSLVAHGQPPLWEISLTTPFALVVGSEGQGVSAAFLEASQSLSIPTRYVESLNAAIACSLALFESARQRSLSL